MKRQKNASKSNKGNKGNKNQPEATQAQAAPAVPQAETQVATGESEALPQVVKDDDNRANGVIPQADIPPAVEVEEKRIIIPDELRTTGEAWNSNAGNTVEKIELTIDSTFGFDYIPVKGEGAFKGYSRLVCSDNKLPVGKPFAGSYGLVNNAAFLDVIGQITARIEKLGLRWALATTGTLMERERSYVSIRIRGTDGDEINIDGRIFQPFLNCLNSIPSNAGCTVTFANNTFCVCCRNTFASVLHDNEGAKLHVAIKHCKGIKAVLSDVPKIVDAYFSGNVELFKQLKRFSEVEFTVEQAEEFFAAFICRDSKDKLTDKEALTTRSANIVETLKGLHVNGKGNKGKTALDLFSAVTEYYTHYSAGETEDKTKQFESSEVGSGAINKQTFYTWLVKAIQEKRLVDGVCKVGNTLLVAYRKASK